MPNASANRAISASLIFTLKDPSIIMPGADSFLFAMP